MCSPRVCQRAAMRLMFVLYLVVIVLGIVGYSLVGVLGR
jgi:hypothetical protein